MKPTRGFVVYILGVYSLQVRVADEGIIAENGKDNDSETGN